MKTILITILMLFCFVNTSSATPPSESDDKLAKEIEALEKKLGIDTKTIPTDDILYGNYKDKNKNAISNNLTGFVIEQSIVNLPDAIVISLCIAFLFGKMLKNMGVSVNKRLLIYISIGTLVGFYTSGLFDELMAGYNKKPDKVELLVVAGSLVLIVQLSVLFLLARSLIGLSNLVLKTKPGKSQVISEQKTIQNTETDLKIVINQDDKEVEQTTYNKESYKNAMMAIQYRTEAQEAFNSLKDLPEQFRLQFLELLESNPKGGVDNYIDTVMKSYYAWLKPYDNDKINHALQEVRKLGEVAEQDFREIIDVLGESVDPVEILDKLKNESKAITQEKNILNTKSPTEKLKYLCDKYKMTSEQLKEKFGIELVNGAYVYDKVKYSTFIEAAIIAEYDVIYPDKLKTIQDK